MNFNFIRKVASVSERVRNVLTEIESIKAHAEQVVDTKLKMVGRLTAEVEAITHLVTNVLPQQPQTPPLTEKK